MKAIEPFIDAFLVGDSLFRFVYKPATKELFLEEQLEESDDGQFLYVPFKDARDVYMEMSHFADEQQATIEQQLYAALSSPSPISAFEKKVIALALEEEWQRRKRAYAQKQIEQWLSHHQLVISR